MIFWMLYANEIKGGLARLFSDNKARKVARKVLDDAENKVSQYFGTLVVVNLCLAAVRWDWLRQWGCLIHSFGVCSPAR